PAPRRRWPGPGHRTPDCQAALGVRACLAVRGHLRCPAHVRRLIFPWPPFGRKLALLIERGLCRKEGSLSSRHPFLTQRNQKEIPCHHLSLPSSRRFSCKEIEQPGDTSNGFRVF